MTETALQKIMKTVWCAPENKTYKVKGISPKTCVKGEEAILGILKEIAQKSDTETLELLLSTEIEDPSEIWQELIRKGYVKVE